MKQTYYFNRRRDFVKKRLIFLLLLVGVVFSLTACGGEVNEEDNDMEDDKVITEEADEDQTDEVQEEVFEKVDLSREGWEIIIEEVIRQASLENISVQLGYTDAATSEVLQTAAEGHEYFLIKMLINKDGSGETISWDKMMLIDDEGNTYKRIDDTFLSDLDMVRMPGTDLNFGSNEGWFAYEIKEGASNLTLNYDFENESLEYTFLDNK